MRQLAPNTANLSANKERSSRQNGSKTNRRSRMGSPRPLPLLVLTRATGFVLRWTKFGRYVFSIGGNERAAILTGVPVRMIKLAAYMLSAFSAGIAGIIETGWLGAGPPISAPEWTAGHSLLPSSGAQTWWAAWEAFGALIGSALLEVIRNSLCLLGVRAFWQGAFIGAFIIIAVTFDRIRNFRQAK